MNFIVDKIKKNYVGYSDKVNASNQTRFNAFTDSLIAESTKASNYQCLPIIKKWLSFFKDKHINVAYDDTKYSKDEIINYYSKEEKTSWTASDFNAYLESKQLSFDNLEGIWKDDTGIYQVGIVKDKKRKNEFIGFIIKADGARWLPQQIKLRIVKNNNKYFLKYFKAIDHSLIQLSFDKTKDTLTFGDGINSSKWYKNSVLVPKYSKKTSNINPFPSFEVLDEKTCLFTMPSFASLENVSRMDSLIERNADQLKKCTHLVIDLRDNFGGSVLSYDKLIPLLYTNPILTEGGNVLSTEDNIRDYYSYIPTNVPDSQKRIFENNLMALKSHVGELYPLYPIDTVILPKMLSYPKSISLLINRNTASAAELFILQAKQSKKVTLYGTNSSGSIDYLEVVNTKLPCYFYTLKYAACKSQRLPNYPLDNIGIKPDVGIPDNISDWIGFVRRQHK